MNINVGYVYGDNTFIIDEASYFTVYPMLFTIDGTLLDDFLGLGKLNIFKINC